MAIDNGDCPACGSSLKDREGYAHQGDNISTDLVKCPFCGCKKCCMCNMGNDVRCLNCEAEEDE